MVNIYIEKDVNNANSPINKYNHQIKLSKKSKIGDEFKSINKYI